jgi:hypothetical protein
LQNSDEIIVQIEPKAKAIFLLAIVLPLGLCILEYAASRQYEIRKESETKREKLWCQVGIDSPGIEICSSSKDRLYVVGIRTDSLSDILIVTYNYVNDSIYNRNYLEYQNITEINFVSYWRFRVRVTPTVDGYVYFTLNSIKTETKNNINEWHSSYIFFFLCIMTIIVELKSLGIIIDVEYK